MSEEHWWCEVPNTITHTADVLMRNKILPASLHHLDLIAHRISTFLTWPFVWWRATNRTGSIKVPYPPSNTESAVACPPVRSRGPALLIAVAGLVADVPAALLPYNLRCLRAYYAYVPTMPTSECLRAYAGTGPYDCSVDLRLLRVLRGYYGTGPYVCCVCHESVSIDDEAMLGDRTACPTCGGPRHYYGCTVGNFGEAEEPCLR